jgi:D-glycero-beta-D-manno-heptose-7-phosphate kinase
MKKNRFDELCKNLPKVGPILVLGDIGIDKYTIGEVNRISPEAPVPVVQVKEEKLKLGLAANISNNFAALGIASTLCGVTGDDNNASILESLLEEQNLKTWGLVRCSDRPTTFKERITAANQQICRVDYESDAPVLKDQEELLLKRVKDFKNNHSALILQDYGKGVLTQKIIQESLKEFKEMGKMVAIDTSINTPPLWYKGATLLKPNLKEAKAMVLALGHRETDVKIMAEILMDKLSLSMLVITLGAAGMAMYDQSGNFKKISTVASAVFDVSGAGDTAISLLVGTLLAGGNLEEAAYLANCGAGVVVGKVGTATVNLNELIEFHQKQKIDEAFPSNTSTTIL